MGGDIHRQTFQNNYNIDKMYRRTWIGKLFQHLNCQLHFGMDDGYGMCLCTCGVSRSVVWIMYLECVCAPVLSAEVWLANGFGTCLCYQHKCCWNHGFGKSLCN